MPEHSINLMLLLQQRFPSFSGCLLQMYACARWMVLKSLCCMQRMASLRETECWDFPECFITCLSHLKEVCLCGSPPPKSHALHRTLWSMCSCHDAPSRGHVCLAVCCCVSLHITATVPHRSTSATFCCLLRWRAVLQGEQGDRDVWPITSVPQAQLLRYESCDADSSAFLFCCPSVFLLNRCYSDPSQTVKNIFFFNLGSLQFSTLMTKLTTWTSRREHLSIGV